MSVPILTFFNNKGGVGKTSLAYHLAWMMAEQDRRILVCDFDPQANLTAAFLDEDALASLWEGSDSASGVTVYRCLQPLEEEGGVRAPVLRLIRPGLALIPGDLALSGFEDTLSTEWPRALGTGNLHRPMRVLSALWTIAQNGAEQMKADLVLMDVGPNLGAINRSALIASDSVLVPLGADLFSLQGLRNLGPALQRWRSDWRTRLKNWSQPAFPLPSGAMGPIGYVVQQHGVRLSRPVKAYDKWVNRVPAEYRRSVLEDPAPNTDLLPADDPHCLATMKHYRSLMPMAQEVRKPIFHLTVADGAIGSHALAVKGAYMDFNYLAERIVGHLGPALAAQ